MQAATAAQPSSRHHKRYVPILAGMLGGCGLILFLGCLAYLFMRRRRRIQFNAVGVHRATLHSCALPNHAYSGDRDVPIIERYELGATPTSHRPAIIPSSAKNVRSARTEVTRLGLQEPVAEPAISSRRDPACPDEGYHSCSYSFGHICYFPASADSAWSEGAEDCVPVLPRTESPGETPLSEWALRGLPSVQDSVSRQSLQHEVPPSSPEFNTDWEHGNPVNWDPNSDLSSSAVLPFVNIDIPTEFDLNYYDSNASTVLSSLGALPFANVDLQNDFGLDHLDWKASTMPANSAVGLGLDKSFPAGCESSQPGMTSSLPPAPCASTITPPNDLPLSPPWTKAVPPIFPSPSQVPPNNAYIPLPPAPIFRCSGCPRTFPSRLRLE